MQNHISKVTYSEDGTERFGFGKNWYNFIVDQFGDEVISSSRQHFLEFLEKENLDGMSMLDIGCGSGLHSTAAIQSGVKSLLSFDYDSNSVLATKFVHEKAGKPTNWHVEQGSVLDADYMKSLNKFDLVYSWGVLHHTGDVFTAMEHAGDRVAPKGLLYIALYAADVQVNPTAEEWLEIKQSYVNGSILRKRYIELWYIWRFMMGKRITGLFSAIRQFRQKRIRGMDTMTDIRDWVGGWPMEFVWDQDAVDFYEKRGFQLKKIVTGEANTEFLFQKLE